MFEFQEVSHVLISDYGVMTHESYDGLRYVSSDTRESLGM